MTIQANTKYDNIIRRMRLRAGVTIDEADELFHFPPRTVQNWENSTPTTDITRNNGPAGYLRELYFQGLRKYGEVIGNLNEHPEALAAILKEKERGSATKIKRFVVLEKKGSGYKVIASFGRFITKMQTMYVIPKRLYNQYGEEFDGWVRQYKGNGKKTGTRPYDQILAYKSKNYLIVDTENSVASTEEAEEDVLYDEEDARYLSDRIRYCCQKFDEVMFRHGKKESVELTDDQQKDLNHIKTQVNKWMELSEFRLSGKDEKLINAYNALQGVIDFSDKSNSRVEWIITNDENTISMHRQQVKSVKVSLPEEILARLADTICESDLRPMPITVRYDGKEWKYTRYPSVSKTISDRLREDDNVIALMEKEMQKAPERYRVLLNDKYEYKGRLFIDFDNTEFIVRRIAQNIGGPVAEEALKGNAEQVIREYAVKVNAKLQEDDKERANYLLDVIEIALNGVLIPSDYERFYELHCQRDKKEISDLDDGIEGLKRQDAISRDENGVLKIRTY